MMGSTPTSSWNLTSGKEADDDPDQIVKKDRQTFLVPKRCVSVREPYSAERRKAASELAKAAGYRPPTPKKGNE